MKLKVRDFVLNEDTLREVRDEFTAVYAKAAGKRTNDDMIRGTKQALEELLARFRKTFGDEANCRISASKSLGTIRFELREYGIQNNPLSGNDKEDEYSAVIIQRYAEMPVYSYSMKNNANIVSMEARQMPVKNRLLKQIALALVLAIITALLIKLLPSDTRTLITDSFLVPFFSKLTSIFSAVATPLVFFGVIGGITGIGSSSAISSMGKKILKNMFKTYLVAAVCFSILGCLIFHVSASSSGGSASVAKDLMQLVLDIVPSNLLECFTTDNDLQVIVIAIFIGFVLLALGERVEKVNRAIEVLGDVVNKMMAIICKALPLVVYFGIVNIMLTDMSSVVQLYKIAVCLILSVLVLVVYMVIRIRRKLKISYGEVVKKQIFQL